MDTEEREVLKEFDPSRFFESFISTAKELILRPHTFFRFLPGKEHIRNPFIFLLVCSFLSSLFIANMSQGNFSWFCELFFSKTISAFIGSIVLHMIVTKLFGSPLPFTATFRIMAYTSLMDLFFWIPALGIIANFYSIYLLFIGIQEVHKLKPRQAGSTIMLILLLITVLLTAALLMAPESMNQWLELINSGGAGLQPSH